MDEVVLVFPHQLYDHHPALSKERSIFIVEDQLFFHGIKRQIKFHKQKMMLHRATLQAYRDRLSGRGYNARYIAFHQVLLRNLDQKDVSRIYIADPVDCTLEKIKSFLVVAKMLPNFSNHKEVKERIIVRKPTDI